MFRKVEFTQEGGLAVKLINKTGAPTVKGTIVSPSTTVNDAVIISPLSGTEPCGVIYDKGIADGLECWVVIGGVAQILMQNATSATAGQWCGISPTAGRAYTATSPSDNTRDRQIGHILNTVTGGTNVLADVIVHVR